MVFVGLDEAGPVFGVDEPSPLVQLIEDAGAEVIVTDGAKGSWIAGQHLAAVGVVGNPLAERLAHADEVVRLRPVEPGGPDDLLKLGAVGARVVIGAPILREEHRGHHIYPFVRALRG